MSLMQQNSGFWHSHSTESYWTLWQVTLVSVEQLVSIYHYVMAILGWQVDDWITSLQQELLPNLSVW
jgi:hypothetical protein